MSKTDTQRRLALLFLFVFVDVLGFSLILPLLPYYADTFDATESVVGLLLAANALTQLVGAPVLGRLSDRYGRRPLLILSITGTIAGFLLLGWSSALWMLFASRILDGFLGGDISLAQAYIADVTDEKSRAKGLGLIGASFGLGFIIGPVLGGTLSAGANYSLPAFVAAGLAILNLLGVIFWLPESLPPERRTQGKDKTEFSARALSRALRHPCTGPLLVVALVSGLAFTTFETTFSLYAKTHLALTAQETSYILAYVGLLVAALQGGGIRLLIKHFEEKQLIFGGSILLAVSLLAWGLTPNLWLLLIVLIPLSLASGTLRVSTNSALTKSVLPEEVGGTLGLAAALAGIARAISPVVGAFLLERISPAAPGILASFLMACLVFYTWRKVLFAPDIECPAPPDLVEPAKRTWGQRLKAWAALLLLVPLVLGGAFVLWAGNAAQPMPEALDALQSDAAVAVTTEPWLVFRPGGTEPVTGLIFYPGGRVDARAYAPAARAIATEGYLVVIVPMPLNLAFLNANAAGDVIAAYPDIERWAVGGHSLGGAMAAGFSYDHPEAIRGLVLWASYPAEGNDLSGRDLAVVSIYGTLDGLATVDKIEASRPLLPPTARLVAIEGGNHAQFGWYGAQSGDNPAIISREKQMQETVAATLALLATLDDIAD
jgi:DHA1 family tetracycline resistance protein-like MFS transporter